MNYKETLDYLFNALPMFQRVGASAFKKDLSITVALCEHLGNPQNTFKSVHVAGTNGKGSSSHALCSVLMEAGYKVGLYTSPHLKSFTERIKVNGVEISEADVISFVEREKSYIDKIKPSFFEMTVGMAFWYFAKEQIDIAVVEVGMGGRLDSTNVIAPEVCLITNIGLDHQQYLGDTRELIAGEKAGIIKKNIPVVIGEKCPVTDPVFLDVALGAVAPIYFAEDTYEAKRLKKSRLDKVYYAINKGEQILELDLTGNYQIKNLPGILKTIDVLVERGYSITSDHTKSGLAKIKSNTGLKGRWQILGKNPTVVCDTGHNVDGIREVVKQLIKLSPVQLHMVIGMVNDKDIQGVLDLLPKNASYYFCQAQIPRAMEANQLAEMAARLGLIGNVHADVNEAIEAAKKNAGIEDVIFIGGSTFVVAEITDL